MRTLGERRPRASPYCRSSTSTGRRSCSTTRLRRGATIVTMPRFDLAQFLAAIERHRITACYRGASRSCSRSRSIRSSTSTTSRACASSRAAPRRSTPSSRARAERRVGCRVQQGYGLTEASPVTHHVHQDDEDVHGTIGTLLPSTEARLVDAETGRDAAPGEPGEIWVRGPQVMLGLPRRRRRHRGDAHARRLAAHGRHRDGRRGRPLPHRRPPQGAHQVQGLPGAPAELEGILLTHPQVADACVVPVRDEEAGEVPKAFIVPHAGRSRIPAR